MIVRAAFELGRVVFFAVAYEFGVVVGSVLDCIDLGIVPVLAPVIWVLLVAAALTSALVSIRPRGSR